MAKNNQQSSNKENLDDVNVKGSVDSNESIDATNENVSNDTTEKPNSKKSGKVKGSVDSNYELDEKDKDHYHVKHSRVETLPSGAQVEDPGSIRIQTYNKNVFEDQVVNKEKGLPSIWDMGETLVVLHDPTK